MLHITLGYVHEKLNIHKVDRIIKRLLERHEVLNINFKKNKKGELKLFLGEKSDFCIDYEFWNDNRLEHIINKMSLEEEPFNFDKDFLFRIKIIESEDNEQNPFFLIRFTFEHLITDGWGISVFLKEFIELYVEPDRVFEGIIKYSEAINRHNQYLKENKLKNKSFFLSKFLNHRKLILPYDFNGNKNTFEGGFLAFKIDKINSRKLLLICESYKSTLFFVYIAIVNILLSKKTNSKTITTGIICAERDLDFTKNQIGLFLNNLPLKFNIDLAKSYSNIIWDIKNEFEEFLLHKNYSFSELIRELGYSLDFIEHPIYNILIYEKPKSFDFSDTRVSKKIRYISLKEKNYSKYELIFCIENKDEIEISIIYNKNLFEADTINGFLKSLKQILNKLITENQKHYETH